MGGDNHLWYQYPTERSSPTPSHYMRRKVALAFDGSRYIRPKEIFLSLIFLRKSPLVSGKRAGQFAIETSEIRIYDDAQDAFMTLPPYTRFCAQMFLCEVMGQLGFSVWKCPRYVVLSALFG